MKTVYNMSSGSIPFYLVTGFLGSGKTTLLKKIAEKFSDSFKIGFIQNEFASINIDTKELKNTGFKFEILEINNGSVFCVCLLSNFINALEKFLEVKAPELIILEASGLSDPISIGEILQHEKIINKIHLNKIICIVDPLTYNTVSKFQLQITRQIKIADIVLINKTDLLTDLNELEKIRNQITQINPFAKIYNTSYCEFNLDLFLDDSYFRKFNYEFKNYTPAARPPIKGYVFKTHRKIEEKKLRDLINDFSDKCLRMKGYFDLIDGKVISVQSVAGKNFFQIINIPQTGTEFIFLSDVLTIHEFSEAYKNCSQQ